MTVVLVCCCIVAAVFFPVFFCCLVGSEADPTKSVSFTVLAVGFRGPGFVPGVIGNRFNCVGRLGGRPYEERLVCGCGYGFSWGLGSVPGVIGNRFSCTGRRGGRPCVFYALGSFVLAVQIKNAHLLQFFFVSCLDHSRQGVDGLVHHGYVFKGLFFFAVVIVFFAPVTDDLSRISYYYR